MRKIITKKTAIRACVLLFVLIAILSIYPLRIWTNVQRFPAGGELVEDSGVINFEYTYQQKFVTQFDRLSSIDVYVSEMCLGRYIALSVCDENGRELVQRFVDVEGHEIPGYINIPLELDVEVGKEYHLLFTSARSKYRVGLENVPDMSGYVGSLFYNWGEVPARHISAIYNYRLPIHKGISLLAIAALLLIAAFSWSITGIYYAKRPEKNSILTVEKTVKDVANPIAAIVFAALMIMVFPLRFFDYRALDILFYELGLLITAGIVFYAINHKSVRLLRGISFWQDIEIKDRVIYVLMMLSMAMALWYASGYMNDLYDIYHTLSQRKIIISLLVMILLTFSLKEILNVGNVAWLLVSCIYGTVYYRQNVLADTEKEYDLHNAALKYLIIILILAGILVIDFVKGLFERKKTNYTISLFGLILAAFLIFIVVFRNTRTWGIVLSLVFVTLYARLKKWKGFKDWYKILSGGLMLNFAISLMHSLLHRYFAGYTSGRFGFIFHTVTVTAEYLTFMGAAATVLLVIKIVAFPKHTSVVELFKSAWKEIIFFGFIMSYAIFTVSRTAYVAIICTMLLVLLVVCIRYKGQFIRLLCTMMAAVLLCFPSAFTLQRIIPSIVGQPVIYDIDDMDSLIKGGTSRGSTNFMCVERFVNLFETKILGVDIGDYNYPDDIYNYDKDGNPLLDLYGYPLEDGVEIIETGKSTEREPAAMMLVANGMTRAETLMLLDTLNGYVDESSTLDVISNGRITIFRSYFNELNLFGHDEMGALLPNGEIAVHAHNTYLQLAYDHGIIAGVLFIILLISALAFGLIKYNKNAEKEPLTLITFAITVGFMIAGITEWVFHFANPMTIALMLSFAGIVLKERENER